MNTRMTIFPLMLLLCALTFASCANVKDGSGGVSLAYLSESGEYTLEFLRGGESCRARLTLGAAVEGGARDYRLEFISPESVEGMTFSRTGGEYSTSIGGKHSATVSCVTAERIAAMFCLVDPAIVRADGSGDTCTLILSADGKNYTAVFDRGSSVPKSISCEYDGEYTEVKIIP